MARRLALYGPLVAVAVAAAVIACNGSTLSGGGATASSSGKNPEATAPGTTSPALPAAGALPNALATLPNGATVPPTTAVVETLRNFVLPPGFRPTSVPTRIALAAPARLVAAIDVVLPVSGDTSGVLVNAGASCYVITEITQAKDRDDVDKVRFATTESDAVYTGIGAGAPTGCANAAPKAAAATTVPDGKEADGVTTTAIAAGGDGGVDGSGGEGGGATGATTGTDAPPTTTTPEPAHVRVFVTENYYKGDLGGLSGAAAVCNTEAGSSFPFIQERQGHYKAMLATAQSPSLAAQFSAGDLAETLYDAGNKPLAATLGAFLNGSGPLGRFPPIDPTTTTPYNGYWTGSKSNGDFDTGGDCQAWTKGELGYQGATSDMSQGSEALTLGHWLAAAQPRGNCSALYHLLCISTND